MAFYPGLDEEEELNGNGPEPVSTIAGPQTTRDQVMSRISQVRNTSGEEGEGAGDVQRDPAYEFIRNNATTAGIGRALNAFAAGTGFKPDNSVYDSMEQQQNKIAMNEMDRSARVRMAIENRKAKDAMFAAQQADKKADNARSDRLLALKEKELGIRHQERADAADERRNKATGDQFKVAGFGKRLQQAEDVFGNLEKGGYNRADWDSGFVASLPSFAQGSNTQEQEQAERNFINAVLRRESGAAISPTEFASAAKQYFPRSGDSSDVLAQKKANRQQVIASIQAESGPAWDKIPAIAGATPKKQKSGSDLIPEANADFGIKPGTVKNGYMYVSGDPANEANWEKVQE